MFLHNSLMQRRTCATTWRKPRRRRKKKYSAIVSISCQLHWVIELKHTTEQRSERGVALVNVAWVVLHCNRLGAREHRQLTPHVHFQVPFLGPESHLKSDFACAGLLCREAL